MRRRVTTLVGAMVLLALGGLPVGARQEATPASGLDGLGLPELEVVVSAGAFAGIPESIEAGRYLVTVTAAADTEFGGGVAFFRPEGIGAAEALEFLAAMAGPPEAMPGATPAAEMEMGAPPPWVVDATFAGGAFAPAGATAQAVVDLGPGEWIAWGDDPTAPQAPQAFAVTGELPADLPEPDASATLTMSEFAIEVTDGALVAGSQVIAVENAGAQPHFLILAPVPEGTTAEQIAAVLDEEMAAEMEGREPEYTDLDPNEDIGEGPYTPTQSHGTTSWHQVDLEAGPYVVICFFPDVADGVPHAYKGMYALVEVAG